MEFKYLDQDKNHPLIDHFYQLKISKEDIPFKSLIFPIGQTNITYVFCEDSQIAFLQNKKMPYKDLILTGQIYGSYNIEVNNESENIGFGMKPTSLYKILECDISKFNNQHTLLRDITSELFTKLNTIFLKNRDNVDALMKDVYKVFDSLPLSKDKNIKHIDTAIDFIMEKDGLLQVNDLLEIIPLSQKSLEIQFKKIIGLTPGKYIRQYRFIRLMQKYGSQKFEIADLMYMFDYYDPSHFSKDFKFFFGQTPKNYFKKDYPIIKKYLKE